MVPYFVFVVLMTLTLGTLGSAQQGPPPPDPHEGQPAYCVNHGGFPDLPMNAPHVCEAMCDRNCGEDRHEPPGCLTYCRPDHCHCLAECEREPPAPSR